MKANTNEFKVIFCPIIPFDPVNYSEDNEDIKPFIYADVRFTSTDIVKKNSFNKEENKGETSGTLKTFNLINLKFEEMELNIHKITIMDLIK